MNELKSCMAPQVAPCNIREPKIFNVGLESHESTFPDMTIRVSEYQLLEAIRVLSAVYFIRITD